VRSSGDEREIRLRPAHRGDLSGISRVFVESFSDSIVHLFGRVPRNRLVFRDVFRLCLAAEPRAFIVADSGGQVVGYIFCPSDMKRLYRAALRGGHLLRWLRHWLSGSYGFGLHPLRLLLLDKFSFIRESLKADHSADARVLSVGVDSEFRGRGVGGRLLEAGMAYLRGQGVTRVRLEVRPHNRPAVSMYERYGFRKVGTMEDSMGPWEIMIYEDEGGF